MRQNSLSGIVEGIDVAKDFSILPAGQRAGREFRKLLESYSEDIVVNFDNTLGVGSSFLKEAFKGFTKKITIISNTHPEVEEKINRWRLNESSN